MRAFSFSAPQSPRPGASPTRASGHALLESLAVVRVLGGVGEPRGGGALADGVDASYGVLSRPDGVGAWGWAQPVGWGVPAAPGKGWN